MWNVSIEKPRKDKHGKTWNFSYWYSGALALQDRKYQRLFFWDDDHRECGVIVFARGKTVPYTRVRNLISELVAKSAVRQKYQRDLAFPLERHYWDYSSFPEELPPEQE
jgi:hypothetical protein